MVLLRAQHFLQLSILCRCLCSVIATQMLPLNENVGHSPLTGNFKQRALDFGSVIEFVQFYNFGVNAHAAEQLLCRGAIWTVCFGEDNHLESEPIALSLFTGVMVKQDEHESLENLS